MAQPWRLFFVLICALMECYAWLASLGSDVTLRGKSANLNFESSTADFYETVDRVGSPYPSPLEWGNKIFGLAKLRLHACWHLMQPHRDDVRQQVLFWQDVLDFSMHGDSYIFEVVDILALPDVEPVQQLANRRLRGLVCDMEIEQATKLSETAHDLVGWLPEDKVPLTIVRLPSAHVYCIVHGVWDKIVLPQMDHESLKAASFSWKKLGISLCDVPKLPSHVSSVNEIDPIPLNETIANEVLQHLTILASKISLDSPEGLEQFHSVERCVHIMDTVRDELSVTAFAKRIKDMQHGHHIESERSTHRTSYKVAFLVHASIMADALRNSSDFKNILKRVVKLIVPPMLQSLLITHIDDHAKLLPHKSTISRWRLLIDAAFMVFTRRSLMDIKYTRYMMTDSSTQHRRDSQHTCYLQIANADIVDVFWSSNSLATFWFS